MNYVPDERIARITGADLVHRPKPMLKAISGEQPDAGVSQMAVALGPPCEADTVTILTAVNPLRTPDPAQYVPADALADLLKDRHQHVALMSAREADARVETAPSGGYITPTMVPWATALCRQNLKAFDGFMQSSAPAYAHLFRRREFHNLPQTGSRERADTAAEIAAQPGLAPCLRTSAAASRGRSVNRQQ